MRVRKKYHFSCSFFVFCSFCNVGKYSFYSFVSRCFSLLSLSIKYDFIFSLLPCCCCMCCRSYHCCCCCSRRLRCCPILKVPVPRAKTREPVHLTLSLPFLSNPALSSSLSPSPSIFPLLSLIPVLFYFCDYLLHILPTSSPQPVCQAITPPSQARHHIRALLLHFLFFLPFLLYLSHHRRRCRHTPTPTYTFLTRSRQRQRRLPFPC